MDLLLLGVVTKAHGLRGEVVVQAHHVASPLWKAGATLFGVAAGRSADDVVQAEPSRTLLLRACRKQIAAGEERLLCTFDGIADRTAAEALQGLQLAVDVASLPALGEGEFYHHELRGFAVVDLGGASLGTVVGIFPGPAQDLLEVRPAGDGDTWFAPFVDAIVKSIDRGARVVTLDPPEGLVP